MKLIDRVLSVFSRSTQLKLGAVQQPNDLVDYIYTIHSQAYQRLTGKSPSRFRLTMTKNIEMDGKDLSTRFNSFVRHLARE